MNLTSLLLLALASVSPTCGTAPIDPAADSGAITDASVCPHDWILAYAAGCGAASTQVCVPAGTDACWGVVRCGCDGQAYVTACGASSIPYAHEGACPPDDASACATGACQDGGLGDEAGVDGG